MATYYVSRKKWARGGKNGASNLLNRQGCRCCLGHVGQQRRITNENLRAVLLPRPEQGNWPKWLVDGESFSEAAAKAANINDDISITEKQREQKLRAIFRANGDRIVFRP